MLNFLFPVKCVFCGKVVLTEEGTICSGCKESGDLIRIMPDFPPVPYLDGKIAAAWYRGRVRKSLHKFKFNRCIGYGKTYAKLLSVQYVLDGRRYDLITWAPSHKWRVFKRGYNQAQVLACALAEELGLPTLDTLKKIRATKQMYGLTIEQRQENVRNAYKLCCEKAKISDKRILIVDDIFTTGSTVSECARMLIEGGASAVGCAVFAHKK